MNLEGLVYYMNVIERNEAIEKSDSLPELLSYACDVSLEEGRDMHSRINSLESFFEDKGFSRGKPKKMAILYVMMRHGHSVRTVEKWWGEADSSYKSFSADLGLNYLEEIKELVNEEVGYEGDSNWTPGDKVYESWEDPIEEHFDVEDEGRNAKITSFGE
jgi:hypothetical protein